VTDHGRRGLELLGDEDHPTNEGRLCSKGRALLHVVRATDDRLTRPLLRGPEGDRVVSWDAAWEHLAERYRSIIAAHGPDSVAFYGSGQCLTEEYYVLNKLSKGFIGTNNYDTNSRLCMSSAVVAMKQSLGADAPPLGYQDIDRCDTVFVIGANPAWAHPIIFRRVEDRLASHPDARLIVADPRRTASAEAAHTHLALRPGTDVPLLHGLAHRLRELGAWDNDYLAAHCEGLDAFVEAIEPWTLERTAAVCDLPAAAIASTAEAIAGRRFISMWCQGLNQSTSGTAKGRALINLHLCTGTIGRMGCGPFSLTGQPNAMGGREVGGMATLCSNHRNLADPAHRAVVAKHWGVTDIPAKPGLTAVDMVEALEDGRIKAVWVVATNPLASMPDSGRVAAALAKAELVVVEDCYENDTSPFAHVVLPAATWLEKAGTMTNSERRVSRLQPLVEAPGEALPDWRILQGFARAMAWGASFAWEDESEIFAEHAALSAGTTCDISGLSYERLASDGPLQWPVPAADHPGTPRLYSDGTFSTPSGKAKLANPGWEPPVEEPDDDFPFLLTTGRIRDQWHTQTKTGRVARLRSHLPRPYVELHPDDAATLGISAGEPVRLRTRRGTCTVAAKFDSGLRRGLVFLPMHWGRALAGPEGATNNCTVSDYDPFSQQPELKHAAVAVERVHKTTRRLVVVGTGAACLGLVDGLEGRDFEVHVVSGEGQPAYDRVQLPHLIDGSREWGDLVRRTPTQFASGGVRHHQGPVIAIHRSDRQVELADGSRLAYDDLILATGSSAAMPFAAAMPEQGVYTLRSRRDADAIMAALEPGVPAVIVGGGLLGLELADALVTRGAQVTILQRSDRLMGKQLDGTAAGLLAEALTERGVDIRFQTSIDALLGNDPLTGVRCDDGDEIPARLLVFAAGTVPNTDLAEAAGLEVDRGIVVDGYCRSSDPAIRAVGECAVWTGTRVGTTAGATAMAQACVRHLLGDLHQPFEGVVGANILKVQGLPLAAAGLVDPDPADSRFEVVSCLDAMRGYYQKCVVRDDRLVGVICVGDIDRFADYKELIEAGTELEDLRDGLLRPGAAAAPIEGELVCSCNRVGDGTIKRLVQEGCEDLGELCAISRAGTGCGSCRPEVARILSDELACRSP
jgi:ferredoxin-nitrate reductase